jgi:predicted ATPase/DNA-binding winged helix-turn-helix (wHTH) protein
LQKNPRKSAFFSVNGRRIVAEGHKLGTARGNIGRAWEQPMSGDIESAFEFESFRLFPSQRLLFDGANSCALGSRAVEILIILLERAGEMVSKQELLQRIWPDSFVDEANLRVHVSALRRALGDGQAGRRYIVNLTGQGYSFVSPVRRVQAPVPPVAPPSEISAKHNIPIQASPLLGRESDIEAVALQLPMRRCVTIAGPGGIGKTTLALAVAQRLLPVYDDGVWFVDLSGVADEHPILPSVAHVLGISLQINGALASLISYLQDKRLLLLLDNCEHVIDEAAKLAESILSDTRQVSVLATSRETLRVTGEWVHSLSPLAMPPAMAALTATEALSFAAVRYFADRAAVNLEGFTLQDTDVPVAIAICRGLDGLPLAIELAAARIDIFGIQGLASALQEPFLLFSEGRRGALPRQQSLMRTLEWSYRLLSPVERTILRRLSVFRGDFTLSGALAIAGGEGIEREEVYSGILTMSAKSLISSDISTGTAHHRHRLLHVTRTLLSQKLQETTESATVLRRHAEYLRVLLTKAESDWDDMARPAWLEIYANSIVDVRAAIDWAFSPAGDASLGVQLTALAVPLGFQLSLIEEFRGRVERALMHSQRLLPPHLVSEMRLNAALGVLTHNAKGPSGARTAQLERAIEVGRRLEPAYALEPLVGLATVHFFAGDYGPAIDVATRAITMGQQAAIPMAVLAAERVLAQAEHFRGNHVASTLIARRVIDHPAARVPLAYNLTPVDRRVSMQTILARILWIQARFEPADRLLQETIELAKKDGPFSLCPALVFGAIPIALWNGDDADARSLTTLLAEQAKRYTLGYWLRWADAFAVVLRVRGGEQECVPLLSDALQFETFATFSPMFLTPEAAAPTESGASGWCSPEIRRVQGEWLLAQQAPQAAAAAEDLFRQALEISRRQGSVSWELRAAISLGRLWKADGRTRVAQDLIAEVLSKCEQQRRTADLTDATVLLAALESDKIASKSERNHPARRRASNRTRASRHGR